MSDLLLETPRLTLRLMESSDLDDLLMIFGDAKVMASFDAEPFNREQMEYWLQRNLAPKEYYGYGLFSVVLKSNQTLIGDCGLEHMEMGGRISHRTWLRFPE